MAVLCRSTPRDFAKERSFFMAFYPHCFSSFDSVPPADFDPSPISATFAVQRDHSWGKSAFCTVGGGSPKANSQFSNELGVEYVPLYPFRGDVSGRMDSQESDATVLLSELAQGNQEAAEKLIPLVYDELKRLARSYMRRERRDHTLQTTALVHEAYLKLVNQRAVNWQGRSHFFGVAAQLMRRILIDHARGHLREKRSGAKVVLPLNEALAFSPEHSEDLLKLNEALDRLSELNTRQSRIVELRFFGGLSVEETAEFLNISPVTVKRDWAVARAWLHGELRRSDGNISKAVGPR